MIPFFLFYIYMIFLNIMILIIKTNNVLNNLIVLIYFCNTKF